jgi:hypothetical protein
MNSTVINSIKDVPIIKCDKIEQLIYLTWNQVDKAELLSRGAIHVKTVHEYQGCESERVIIVRLQKAEDKLTSSSLPHVRVAISRHTEQLDYYTVPVIGHKEILSDVIERVKALPSIAAEHGNINTGYESLKGTESQL